VDHTQFTPGAAATVISCVVQASVISPSIANVITQKVLDALKANGWQIVRAPREPAP
jgi:hypothetical protein